MLARDTAAVLRESLERMRSGYAALRAELDTATARDQAHIAAAFEMARDRSVRSIRWTAGITFLAFGLLAILSVLIDRKSTRLNSSHPSISYAVFCLKKKISTNL